MNTSSSPGARLLELPLTALQPHPANPNVMGRDALAKLRRHIERSGNYPPLVVRPFGDGFQIIDGHQRAAVLRELGRLTASCVVWACDDETALLLLATLNRLHGEDVPGRRAALLDELVESMGRDNLLALIPEDATALDDLLALLPGGDDPFAALEAEATKALAQMPVTLTVVVEAEEEREILRVLDQLITGRPGARSRGGALARIARHFAECEPRDA